MRIRSSKITVCFIAIFCLSLGASVIFAQTDYTDENIITIKKQIESEVRIEYENDPEFLKLITSKGRGSGEEMINRIVERRLEQYIEEKEFGTHGQYGDAYYCIVPSIKQAEKNWCGAACVLQTLYGLGKEWMVSGSTNAQKQDTLVNNMMPDFTHVYKLTEELNKYINDKYYIWTRATSSNLDTLPKFNQRVTGSLYFDRPVILRVRTQYLSYYDYSTTHYVNVDYILWNGSNCNVSLVDPHYDDSYFGYHYLSSAEAYSSISNPTNDKSYMIHY
ncbi:MAG TPA: hypothetical protein GX004_05690 [Firmicutes bacterium]|nr:hypothetical protein [Bacillota bacterium]